MDDKTTNAVRDLETIPITRGQLVDLLARIHRAEGASIKSAEVRARCIVDAHFTHVLNGA